MEWKEIVKIQYDVMLKSSTAYVAILSAIIVFAERLSLGAPTKILLIFAILSALAENVAVLYLTNVHRQGLWLGGGNTKLNNQENKARKIVLLLPCFTA